MPSVSYRENLLKRLLDPDFASGYLEAVFSEALEDGFIDAFPLALEDVMEAAEMRQVASSETDLMRKRLYQLIGQDSDLIVEKVIAALKEVGLTHEIKPARAQVLS